MLIPLLVGFPLRLARLALRADGQRGDRERGSRRAVGVAAGHATSTRSWVVNAIVIGTALPAALLIVIFLVRNAYHRLQEPGRPSCASRAARWWQVADAARRSLERDLHDGAQQRLLAMSVTIERAAQGDVGRAHATRPRRLLGSWPTRTTRSLARAAGAGARRLPAAAHRARPGGRDPVRRRAARSCPSPCDARSFPRPAQQTSRSPPTSASSEALTNAAKHSGATDVQSRCGASRVMFIVSDNGRGFDAESVSTGGLLGMEARAAAAGGMIALDTAPGRGTTLGPFPGGQRRRRAGRRALSTTAEADGGAGTSPHWGAGSTDERSASALDWSPWPTGTDQTSSKRNATVNTKLDRALPAAALAAAVRRVGLHRSRRRRHDHRRDIKNNTVTSADLKNKSLTGKDVKDGALAAADLSSATVSALRAATAGAARRARGPAGRCEEPRRHGRAGLSGLVQLEASRSSRRATPRSSKVTCPAARRCWASPRTGRPPTSSTRRSTSSPT